MKMNPSFSLDNFQLLEDSQPLRKHSLIHLSTVLESVDQIQLGSVEILSDIDMVPNIRSWWSSHISVHQWMYPTIWHHLQVDQDCPCSPRLQKEIERTYWFYYFISNAKWKKNHLFLITNNEIILELDIIISRLFNSLQVQFIFQMRVSEKEQFYLEPT